MATLLEVYYRRAAFYCAIFVGKRTESRGYPYGNVFCLLWEVFVVVKRFTTGSRNAFRDVRKSQMMPDQVRKWLRQPSKLFCVVGFDALVNRWDKCINVYGGFVEK
jgi:hypothetical protein